MKCSRCKQDKAVDEFYNNKSQGRGKTHYCKPCQSDYMADVYQRTKDKRAQYLADNKDVIAERKRSYYLRSTFGITIEKYERMEVAQNGVCLICREPEVVPDPRNPNQTKRLAVDHCHETQEVRGLLCQRCNMGLGYFRDRHDLLFAASEYLKARK